MSEQLQLLCSRTQPESEIEWQDIADLRTSYTGQVEHRDTVRKGSKLLYEYLDAGWVHKPEESKSYAETDIDVKIRELQKERNKIQTEKIELNRINRQQDRFELFYEKVAESIHAYPPFDFSYRNISNNKTNQKEYLLTIADIHAGSYFSSINNQYSYEECERRFESLLDYCVDYVQEKDIETLSVAVLGDDIQGLLRISDLKLNETSVVEATVFVARVISSFLNELSKYVDIKYYHVPTSNHSQLRSLGTKANEIAVEDMEYVIGNYIKDVLVNNKHVEINLNFGEESIEIPIYNYNIIAMHGHQFKNTNNIISQLSMLHKKFYDYLICAHFHSGKEETVSETSTSDVEVLVCPSFVGSCPYSDRLRKGAKAACKIFVFDEVNGHVGTDKIILN